MSREPACNVNEQLKSSSKDVQTPRKGGDRDQVTLTGLWQWCHLYSNKRTPIIIQYNSYAYELRNEMNIN